MRNPLLRRPSAYAALLLCSLLGDLKVTACTGESFRTLGTDQTVRVLWGGNELIRYQYAPNPYKPYVYAWYTPEGRQVLRDAPADHLHHHGLMFAIGAAGVNFWEEAAQAGKQVPAGGPELVTQSINGRLTAMIRQELEWQNAEGTTLMVESRQVLEVRYAVLAWDGRVSEEEIGAAYEGWLP